MNYVHKLTLGRATECQMIRKLVTNNLPGTVKKHTSTVITLHYTLTRF